MPQLDPTGFAPQLVWLAISFILLYLLMAKVALPRVGAVIEGRQARIEGDLQAAASLKAEADAVIAAYERALIEARVQAAVTVKKTTERLTAEAAVRQQEVNKKLAEETAAAERRIAVAAAEAMANVRTVAVEVALAATARLIGADLGDADTSKAVEQAMGQQATGGRA